MCDVNWVLFIACCEAISKIVHRSHGRQKNSNHSALFILTEGELLEQEIPHDLLKAKNQDYRLRFEVITFIYSSMNDRKQNAKIIIICNMFLIVLYGVPQGSGKKVCRQIRKIN